MLTPFTPPRTKKQSILATEKANQPYLSGNGSLTNGAVFACSADDFNFDDPVLKGILWEEVSGQGFHRQEFTHHASYFFNGLAPDEPETRMGGKPFSAVHEPSSLVLAGEVSSAYSLSTHERKEPYQFNNARNIMSFVDGHVSLIPMYWNGVKGWGNSSFFYEPPVGYEYKWSEK